MDRRTFLSAAAAVSLTAIAGCSGDDVPTDRALTTSGGGSPTATESPTASPTEASTPGDTASTPDDTTSAPSGDRHPAAQVAYEFYAALVDGEFDAANEFGHPDPPDSSNLPVTEESTADTESVEILGAQLDEVDGEYAYVSVELDNNGTTSESIMTLRTYEGEWRVWSSQDCRDSTC